MSEAKKRSHTSDSESSSDDDDDFGPLPSTSAAPSMSTEVTSQQTTKKVMKKRKKLEHEQLFLENLPLSSQYEKSYMHRDNLTHLATSKKYDYIITGSCDGHIKFWKKMLQGIEFVKHFQAHLGAITGMSISPNDQKLVTIGEDRMLKFFDITCYDMSNMISLDYIPGAICWLSSGKSGIYNRVAVSDLNSGIIRIYADDQQTHLEELSFHSHPVRSMDLHVSSGIVISTDSRGMIEYWSSLTFLFPDQSTGITFQMKTETDLYELAKNRTLPCRLTISPRNDYFVITCTDHKIRLFDFYSGKLKKIYNESSEVYAPSPSSSNGGSHGSHGGGTSSAITNNMAASIGGGKYLSEQDLGRRRATEREFESDEKSLKEWNALFDESGNFLIFGTLKGVKVVNLVTNQVCFIIGSSESGERFISLTLYQGTPKVDLQLMLARAAESGKSQTADEFASLIQPDPMLFCTSLQKRRFFCFSRRLPDESEESRDVLNEKPREDERVTLDTTANSKLGSEAVIQTDKGEIHIKLFTHECPKTVENFCTHARNGYYDNLIFHRVIKGFMIQTGCPLGDGTGGESIWGGEFGDEFHRNLRHDRPFTVSMANGGPNTNGSQFFITTAPTPWLDNKHTVFGRVTRGYEVVAAIENVEVGSYDKPFQNIVMRHIEIIR